MDHAFSPIMDSQQRAEPLVLGAVVLPRRISARLWFDKVLYRLRLLRFRSERLGLKRAVALLQEGGEAAFLLGVV